MAVSKKGYIKLNDKFSYKVVKTRRKEFPYTYSVRDNRGFIVVGGISKTKADAIKSLVPSFIGLGMCASVLIISKLESTQKEYNVREEKRC